MRKKRDEGSSANEGPAARLTPADVQGVEFRLAFRGYNERDVDAFLDRVTEDLGAILEENASLRAAGAAVVPPASAELETGRAEAERIVGEARDEAERIVRDARDEAAVAAGARGDVRSAVAPFLNREREFLQRLGALVQEHAEDIRGMVSAFRSRTESSPERVVEIEETEPGADEASTSVDVRTSAPGSGSEGRTECSLRDLFWGEG
jgi:DivIVA domain-containing protein